MIHIYISGFVQGVGFRQFIKYNAKKLNINGWIKNLPDGRVEAVFDGEEDNLKKLVEICQKGTFLSKVKNVEVDWNSQDIVDTIGFEIR